MNEYFPHLYEPIQIAGLRLKNRLISSPTSQADIEPDGTLGVHNIAYFGHKARGGAALVTVGDGIVHPTGQDHPRQVLLYKETVMASLLRCAEEIHKYGSKACIQLSHGGIACNPAFIGGRRPIGPSELPVSIGFQTEGSVETKSEAMTVEMMEELARAYGEAAARVKKCGFDMVQLHGAHGWLISQFLSPNTNRRTDEYGGSAENRCRFPIMVLKAIRNAVGPKFPISMRINGWDGVEGGLELEDSLELCRILEPYVDAFHVSASVHYEALLQDLMQSPIYTPRGHLLKYAAAVKQVVRKPVITIGGHSDLATMEEIVASGQADVIAMGRQLVADPYLPKKGMLGKANTVRQCLRCANCQSGRFTFGAARCSLNPLIGREYESDFWPPAKEKRKVLVIGGGPGGMEAAITAARRGHEVTLCEAADSLGGALKFARYVDFKSDLYRLIGTMEQELKELPVTVKLNTRVTPEEAKWGRYDAVLVAVGADEIVPPFPGVEQDFVMMAAHAHEHGENVGENVVVIGGGMVGCETALDFAGQGKQVTIVEMAPRVSGDANFRYVRTIAMEIEKRGVQTAVSTRCTSIGDHMVEAIGPDGAAVTFPADTVILAVGMKAREGLAESFRECAPQVLDIGNCVKPGQVKEAIRSGFDAAMFLD